MSSKLKLIPKNIYSLLRLILSYLYDAKRYFYSTVYPYYNDIKRIEGKIIKRTHSIEKRLSFENRDPSFGKAKASELIEMIEKYYKSDKKNEVILRWSTLALEKYVTTYLKNFEKEEYLNRLKDIKDYVVSMNSAGKQNGGIIEYPKENILKASRGDFREFSQNRHSIRDFSGPAGLGDIKKAISIALKCPSNCNLQPVKIHLIQNKNVLEEILMIQRGNRGFKNKIPQLLVITANISLYNGSRERNQCFVDGGIFSLSLCYSLHYYGIASCMLNWAATPNEDKEISRIIKLPVDERVIVTMAIGLLPDKIIVPVSARRSVDGVFKIIN